MDYTCNLLLGHIWAQYESFHVEPVKEKFQTISLDQVVGIYRQFPVDKPQLFHCKSHKEFVSVIFA